METMNTPQTKKMKRKVFWLATYVRFLKSRSACAQRNNVDRGMTMTSEIKKKLSIALEGV
ncbi:MAG: hypothetical protein ACK5KR_05590 [Breznakia sp.]